MRHPEIHAVLKGLLDTGGPQRLPELPNFGIFYLSISSAAALIVDDLRRSNRTSFGFEEGSDQDRKKLERRLKSRLAELIADLEARLLASVENGRLRCCTQNRTLEDFLQRGDLRYIPEYTYIHYSDLVAWLATSGYVDRNSPTQSPAFEEYEQRELDLLENVQRDLNLRRDQRGKRIESYLRVLAPPASAEDAELRLKERLADVLERLEELEQENEGLKALGVQAADTPVNALSKHSYLKMIGMLCELRKYKIETHNITTIFERDTLKSAFSLNNDTIRKIFREVVEEQERTKK